MFVSRSRSPSPYRSKRGPPSPKPGRRQQNEPHRENPIPSSVLGVFGLSQYTTERDLRGLSRAHDDQPCQHLRLPIDMFGKYGRIKDIQVVIDKKTNKSRGFGFIYYDEVDSAVRVSTSLRSRPARHSLLSGQRSLECH